MICIILAKIIHGKNFMEMLYKPKITPSTGFNKKKCLSSLYAPNTDICSSRNDQKNADQLQGALKNWKNIIGYFFVKGKIS